MLRRPHANAFRKLCSNALVFTLTLVSPQPSSGAAARQDQPPTPVCDEQHALYLIRQQVKAAKSFDDATQTIAILIRAADPLWAYLRGDARAAFEEAYELAKQHSGGKGREDGQEGKGRQPRPPDQRPLVIKAIARRDPEWAQRLTADLIEETRQEAEKAESTNNVGPGAGEKLLRLAISLLQTNPEVATAFARSSLRYPASYALGHFLFQLAGHDQKAADQLYREAIGVYGSAPVAEFLYLSAYPFGAKRIAGPEALSTYFSVPQGFVPNPELQRLFVQLLLRRAGQSLKASDQPVSGPYRLPESAQIYLALSNLEPLVARHQPAQLERITEAKWQIGSEVYADAAREITDISQRQQQQSAAGGSFRDSVERIERESNQVRRDRLIAQAVLASTEAESTNELEGLAGKTSSLELRQQLFNWLFVRRAQRLIKEGLLDEAAQLIEKVEGLEYRAYLSFQIASESLRRHNDRGRVQDLLNKTIAAAEKAPETTSKARTLLGAAYLYARFDYSRALEVLAAAIKTTNKIAAPDLTSTVITQAIKGEGFSVYASYEMPGFSLETVFRELGGYDFTGTVYQAQGLEDKFLRATAIVTVASRCLMDRTKPKAPTKQRLQSRY